MKARVYAKPEDERAFLTELAERGAHIDTGTQPFARSYDLYDLVLVCYWSKGMEQAVEVPCQVVARRLLHNEKFPSGIKVRVMSHEKPLIKALLDEA